jgi:uncharacterized protein (TIGR00375 family)
MKYIADFHVHSKYSRATARNLDLENLYVAAQIKGITVVGTGDFTHPAWFSELSEKLVPAEPGLFKLKDSLARDCDVKVPDSCKAPIRFILTAEISNIYKKKDRTRKNHNLIFLPDLEEAKRFNKRLEAVGNIRSDGRPILGLDAKHLLDILISESREGFLVPAHIWTPWFSLLGSKSGFDSIEECFEDLSPEIFAVETGLSSDPAMNRRLSGLDNITLISNSDAHSPFNLGREANRFHTDLSFPAIKKALKTGNPEAFSGTFEFYPEEGKYHFDGHRKCGFCCDPEKSMAYQGLCPVCGKPLTLGVLYRVEELADRKSHEPFKAGQEDVHLVPLPDILSGIFMKGSKSGKIQEAYNHAIEKWGPELGILHDLPIKALESPKVPLLGEAILRMREGRIHLIPGYDGEYGKVEIFTPEERQSLLGQKSLFRGLAESVPLEKESKPAKPEEPVKPESGHPATGQGPRTGNAESSGIPEETKTLLSNAPLDRIASLNEKQQAAVKQRKKPLLIAAGPGTGKTRTITHKIAYLISSGEVLPENILAVTFTNKAALEMKERLSALLKNDGLMPNVCTFHGLCHGILSGRSKKAGARPPVILDDEDQTFMISSAIREAGFHKTPGLSSEKIQSLILRAKQEILSPESDLSKIIPKDLLDPVSRIYGKYRELMEKQEMMDYEDLIFHAVKLLENPDPSAMESLPSYSHVFVDEYQDLNPAQFRIIKALCPIGENLCVIGDPDQSIYGFRGSNPAFFNAFMTDFPGAEKITLDRNYRSCETILKGSLQVIQKNRSRPEETSLHSGIQGIKTLGVICSSTDKSEAVSIGKRIEEMVGGLGFHSMDFGFKQGGFQDRERSFSDFALLYRTQSQGRILADTLMKANIPCRMASRNAMMNQKGLRELISFFRLAEDRGSLMDFQRISGIPGVGLGAKSLDSFRAWFLKTSMTFSQALAHARRFPIASIPPSLQVKLDRFAGMIYKTTERLKHLPVQDKILLLMELPILKPLMSNHPEVTDALAMLVKTASVYGEDGPAFLSDLALKTDVDFYDPRAQCVSLMTLHASKGLEFPVVFICGCEQGLIPFVRHEGAQTDFEEERRLFYVAMTRAKEELYFSWSKKRSFSGKPEIRKLSPFVEEMQDALLRNENGSPSIKKKPDSKQLPLF